MLEIEVKAEGTEELVEGVRSRGDLVGERRQVDTYYRHPCRDFAETDEALRVREVGGHRVVTYKGPKIDPESKSRVEVETPIGMEAGDVLERLGFEPLEPVRKQREVYRLDGFLATVDHVEGLGTYVEAETEGTGEEMEELRDELKELLTELGAERFERRSYLELLNQDL